MTLTKLESQTLQQIAASNSTIYFLIAIAALIGSIGYGGHLIYSVIVDFTLFHIFTALVIMGVAYVILAIIITMYDMFERPIRTEELIRKATLLRS